MVMACAQGDTDNSLNASTRTLVPVPEVACGLCRLLAVDRQVHKSRHQTRAGVLHAKGVQAIGSRAGAGLACCLLVISQLEHL